MRYFRFALLALLALVSAAASGGVAEAATFTVNSAADAADANPGDGACDDGSGNCTLRAAIQETNALSGADTINVPDGVYGLTLPGTNEDAAATGDLDVTDDLTIRGAGQDATVIDGGDIDRVLETVGSISVDVSGVTMQNGSTASFFPEDDDSGLGGGIFNGSGAALAMTDATVRGNWASHGGGGIFNAWPSGSLTLIRSTVTDNTGGVAVEAGGGGGISNGGTATLIDSTVSGNLSGLTGGGIGNGGTLTLEGSTVSGNTVGLFSGGGIFGGGTLTVTNSTISGNTVGIGGLPDRGEGGGIYLIGVAAITNSTISGNTANILGGGIANGDAEIFSGGTLTVTDSTITGNSAGASGGGIFNNPGDSVTLRTTIVANSTTGGNCAGPITSAGHNLEDAGACGFADPGDVVNASPLLGPLAENGGPTLTHALLAGSPAIDRGDNTGCPETDQRGVARPVDGDGDGVAACDIGAYEAPEGTSTPATPTPSATPTATPAPAATSTPTPAQLPESGGAPGQRRDGAPLVAVGAVLIAAAGTAAVVAVRRQGRGDV